MTPYGIEDTWLERIRQALCADPKVRRILLFGSRARGDHWTGSDIDLAVDAPELQPAELSRLRAALEDLPLVFTLDLIHLQSLPAAEPLLAQIQRDAVVLWQAPALAA